VGNKDKECKVMGIRWGIGVLLGVGPILLYLFHENFRLFVNETIDAAISGIRNGMG
jgi:hypothetical protein